ncbi:HEAT repeat domain-containing protein [Halosolutus amylolyticus]|uniref:HEAT repeat domain-containing protein n=1 Tax=Halosolutus amylolyticus TaxID=2932267 RepID=A0ABD5PPH2_9EURY
MEDWIPALVEHLDHPTPVVRRNVCKALGHLEVTIVVNQLSLVADSDPDDGVQETASWAVGQLRTDPATARCSSFCPCRS